MNTLNTDACNTEIKEEKKKKKNLWYRNEKETEFVPATIRSIARIIPLEPALVT